MQMRMVASAVLLLTLAVGAGARTVGYWQLDGGSDGRDAIANHAPDYVDLLKFGTLTDAQPPTTGGFTLPNPSTATWRAEAGDGVAATDALATGFTGAPGWYSDGFVEDLRFDHDRSFTAECWFRTNAVTGYIMGNRHATAEPTAYTGWQLWATSGGTLLRLYAEGRPDPNSSFKEVTHSIAIQTWYHVAVVWDHDDGPDGMLRLYVDGVEVGSTAGDPTWAGVTGGHWAIGQRALYIDEEQPELGVLWGQTGFSGQMDEVRFIDEALGPDQFLNGSTPYQACQDGTLPEGDLNGDCTVDMLDLPTLVSAWLDCTQPGDPACGQP